MADEIAALLQLSRVTAEVQKLSEDLKVLQDRYRLLRTGHGILDTDPRLKDARKPLKHGEVSHTGYIGDENQVKFDIATGHHHDGIDSRSVAAGVSSFLALTDTPDAYTGQAGKYCKVNPGETALIFDTPTGTGDVVGPASSVDSRIALFDGLTGKLLKDSGKLLANSANNIPVLDASALIPLAQIPATLTGKDADTLDGSHAAAFALAGAGVTNGNSHDHVGGDGAQIDHTGLSNIGVHSHAQIDSALGYPISFFSTSGQTTNDATTYWWAPLRWAGQGTGAMFCPVAGTITKIYGQFNQTAGSNETSSLSIRHNNTTDILVSDAIVNNAAITTFSKTDMSQAVAAGDYIELKWVTPTWVTNPGGVVLTATVWVST